MASPESSQEEYSRGLAEGHAKGLEEGRLEGAKLAISSLAHPVLNGLALIEAAVMELQSRPVANIDPVVSRGLTDITELTEKTSRLVHSFQRIRRIVTDNSQGVELINPEASSQSPEG